MKILVKAKAGAKRDRIEKSDDSNFTVSVKAVPDKGEANEAIIKLLAKYFSIPQKNLKIIQGRKSKQKIVEIIT